MYSKVSAPKYVFQSMCCRVFVAKYLLHSMCCKVCVVKDVSQSMCYKAFVVKYLLQSMCCKVQGVSKKSSDCFLLTPQLLNHPEIRLKAFFEKKHRPASKNMLWPGNFWWRNFLI